VSRTRDRQICVLFATRGRLLPDDVGVRPSQNLPLRHGWSAKRHLGMEKHMQAQMYGYEVARPPPGLRY